VALCVGIGLMLVKPLSEKWWGQVPADTTAGEKKNPAPPRSKEIKAEAGQNTSDAKQSKRQVPRTENVKPERAPESESHPGTE